MGENLDIFWFWGKLHSWGKGLLGGTEGVEDTMICFYGTQLKKINQKLCLIEITVQYSMKQLITGSKATAYKCLYFLNRKR